MEKAIGKVTHFYDKASVAVLKMTDSGLKVGDTVKFVKGTEEHTEAIGSMQIDHKDVTSVKKGEEVAVKVSSPVKEGTAVYKTE
ncbi:MAG: translation elongation factor-like protein [Candidatus Niyogibacteria bacterium]|nr:translation elongation factor-like protein [Candidatus Niyogibacteria bacterium]